MPTLRTYNVFISHTWTYGYDYYRLVDMLDGTANFNWRNFSVSENDLLHGGTARQLRNGLDRQIRRVHVVLMLSGVYATHSDWMQEEWLLPKATTSRSSVSFHGPASAHRALSRKPLMKWSGGTL